MLNALSIDLEDWFHAELVRSRIREDFPERRVAWAVEPILALLQRYDVRATFFVVGDVLRHHRDLVRRIYDGGHEIGCHGWSHRTLHSLEPERFAYELDEFDSEARTLLPLEEIVGFRAPSFSLDERSSWAIEALRARGYRYDSSIFPMRTWLYGVDECPADPYRPSVQSVTEDHPDGDLIEFPMSACQVGGFSVPVSGGFYLRAMPMALLKRMLSAINTQGHPFVIYLHPWEADAETPRVKGLSPVSQFVTYINRGTVLRKLETLLQDYQLAPLREVLGIEGGRRQVGTAG